MKFTIFRKVLNILYNAKEKEEIKTISFTNVYIIGNLKSENIILKI